MKKDNLPKENGQKFFIFSRILHRFRIPVIGKKIPASPFFAIFLKSGSCLFRV